MRRLLYILSTGLLLSTAASAGLIEQSGTLLFGTGLGNVPTILTVQATGAGTAESGCVAWIGGATVTGAAACSGFVQQGALVGLNQTQLISDAALASGFSGAIDSYGDLALVLNVSQTGLSNPLAVDSIQMIITNPETNAVFRSSGVVGPNCVGAGCTLIPASPGTGTSGVYVFTLDAAQQAEAATLLGSFSTSFRVGASLSASNATGGPETIYLGAVSSEIPEPATFGMLGLGLVGIALGFRRVRAADRAR